ncbi:ArnT family glycosyltransferase [Streptomyces albus]
MPPSRTAERTATAPTTNRMRLVAVLAALSVLTRLPSFFRTPWNPDEGFLATQARQLAHGGVLYDTVVDRKPPLVPWLYRGAFAVFGDDSLWPLRVAAVLAVLAGAVLAASIAARRWGERAAWTAGICYVFLTVGLSPEDTQAATFEVFMLPWTVAAIWCAERSRWLCAGLAVAGAVLSKQTGGAVLLPVFALLWQTRAGWGAALRVAAGAALPVVSTALAYQPGRFLYWIATGSGSYPLRRRRRPQTRTARSGRPRPADAGGPAAGRRPGPGHPPPHIIRPARGYRRPRRCWWLRPCRRPRRYWWLRPCRRSRRYRWRRLPRRSRRHQRPPPSQQPRSSQ